MIQTFIHLQAQQYSEQAKKIELTMKAANICSVTCQIQVIAFKSQNTTNFFHQWRHLIQIQELLFAFYNKYKKRQLQTEHLPNNIHYKQNDLLMKQNYYLSYLEIQESLNTLHKTWERQKHK